MPRSKDNGVPAAAPRKYVELLGERFPHVKALTLQLLERNESFRELCEEYEACTEAAERLERSTEGYEHLRREYVALRLRLEGELLRYISEHQGGNGVR